MRVGRDDLIYKALHVLYEATEQAKAGPVAGSLGLRLALAFLYAHSDGPTFELPDHRYTFDQFWRVVRDPGKGDWNDGNHRHGYALAAFQQIQRQVRCTFIDPGTARAHRARQLLADQVRAEAEHTERGKDDKRRYYFRPPPDRKR